jgi:hypothetical protein
MTVSATSQKAQSAFQRELEDFKKQFARMANCLLNRVFDLSVKGSQRRKQMLIMLFLGTGVLFTLTAYSLGDWRAEIGRLLQYFFNLSYAQQNPDTVTQFFEFTFGAILSPRTLRYLPIFILPFILALQSAAIYLADIFELSDTKVARKFILQVALGGGSETLHIKNGDVVEKDRNSPIFQIGGPGKVTVELDSVALFEKPDGKPHLIDSTKTSNNILEGFERYRKALDLRDQFLELSERDKSSVIERSLDGMWIKATDVRLLYRVYRDKLKPSLEQPYPYIKEAVFKLIYNGESRVPRDGTPLQKSKDAQDSDKLYPSAPQMVTIDGLIRAELGKFMRKHKLTRYLSSYGQPEYETALKREEEITKIRSLVADPKDPVESEKVPSPPKFESRPKITSLFTEFTSEFTREAIKRGVDLQWIGIGTWKSLDDIIPEKHIEAWKISMENLSNGSESAIEKLGQDTKTQKKIQLIQDVPSARFKKDRANGMDYDFIVQNLLLAYREQLVKVKELLEESGRPVPKEISYAINYIDSVLKYIWVGKGDVPPPSTISEETWYELLLQITGKDRKRVERLIENERKIAPGAERKELIRRAIIRLLRSNP